MSESHVQQVLIDREAASGYSGEFVKLIDRVAELESKFCSHNTYEEAVAADKTVDVTEVFCQDNLKAFRLLVHAEIEYYLEEMAKNVCGEALKEWVYDRKSSNIIISLVASHYSGSKELESAVADYKPLSKTQLQKNNGDVVVTVTELAHQYYRRTVDDNNGIKERNIKNLFYPLGIVEEDLELGWLAVVDEFGSMRGLVAHKGNKVQSPINPMDEKLQVINVLDGVHVLEDALNKKVSRISGVR